MKLQYTLTRKQNGRYTALRMKIMLNDEKNYRTPEVEIDWQTDPERIAESKQDDTYYFNRPWYGGEMKVKGHSEEYFTFAAKVIKRILGKDYYTLSDLQPADVIKRLNAKRVVHDTRVDRYVEIDKVLPADYLAYIDDYNTLGNYSGCKYGAVANSPENAAKQILVQAAEKNDTDFITKFVTSGSPVITHRWSSAPSVKSDEELLTV